MARDIIIIIEEGVMRGVFGAGVVTAFQEANIYPRVCSVYGSSAGAHDAAYFLAQQTRLGSSIYYEDLLGDSFIAKRKIWRYARAVILSKLTGNRHVDPVANIDYLIEVESRRKRIDVERIKSQPIDFFVRVFDIRECRWAHLDGKKDTLQALRASSSASPFYPHTVSIDGNEYIDGGTVRSKDFLKVVAAYSDKKILYVINHKKTVVNTLLKLPFMLFESILVALLFGWRVAGKKLTAIFRYPTLRELAACPNVITVVNERRYPGLCTEREKLLDMYQHGIEKGRKVLKYI